VVDGYTVLRDFAGSIAVLCAAAAATYFARQQAKTATRQAETALDQLRFNLFDRRYAIYDGVKQLISLLLRDPTNPDLVAVTRQYVAIDEARFFFSQTTHQWLETIRDDCQALIEASAAPTAQNAQDRAAMKLKLYEHLKAMPKRFDDDLSFRQLTKR
jgi:hypothetical protein